MRLFEVNDKQIDDKYTTNVNIPQYLPSCRPPLLCEMLDKSKYLELLRDINLSNVTEEEKVFLRLAASRHIVFNYRQIADYYSHASPEMQQLMEKSALVIIDEKDAIANGYMRLSKNIKRIMDSTGRKANEK